ncbi:GNAT family N-acetyltransferase [Flavobacterium sp. NST-5]|uniref:GNAT family N-acetyltransferase n=1 Tax=Flavobacterium ichthyis TaxID=2698827 RepID=A0ABW9Z664_9FLAO|nr:GNAT family N-acetyltransferase [Flavobacterium ichthyis]NBL64315.1 GNAT family N-acetyltransferase [Flavobacterium ichthyis]
MIREATVEDLPSILEIVNYEIAHSTSIYDEEPRTLELQKNWFEEKKKDNFPVFVAIIDEIIVGFATYGTFRAKSGFRFTVEHSVYVKGEFSGRGIGKQLLETLIIFAKAKKLHRMIGCIDAENQSSIAFHEKFGFKKSGVLKETGFKFNRWLDLQFMALDLA